MAANRKASAHDAQNAAGEMVKQDWSELPDDARAKYENAPEVGFAIKVLSISAVNLAENTFSGSFNLNVAWKGDKDFLSPEDIQFYRTTEMDRDDVSDTKKGSGGWDYFFRIACKGTFEMIYDLQHFPLDSQRLSVLVRLKKEAKLLHLPWGPTGSAFTVDPRVQLSEYVLKECSINQSYHPSFKFGKLAGYDPEVDIGFTISRKPAYAVVNFGIMTSFLVSLAATTFAIPVEDVGSRLGADMTLVLTAATTKYLMMDKMPPVAYFTYMDYHIIICMLGVFFLCLENMAPVFLRADLVQALETYFGPVLGMVWTAYHVLLGQAVLKHMRYVNHGQASPMKSKDAALKRQPSS